MPTYFGPIAPYCPISQDQPTGPMKAPSIRTTVPIARDLASAIAAVNILRSIVSQIVYAKTINNIYMPPVIPGSITNKMRKSRWSEDKAKRVRRRYKYYGRSANGDIDRDIWVLTERIERMVWNDRAWQTSLAFEYGDKGEGERQPQEGDSNA